MKKVLGLIFLICGVLSALALICLAVAAAKETVPKVKCVKDKYDRITSKIKKFRK